VACAIHPDCDAVGICTSCGAGVCTACGVTVAGLTYCHACLEAGRYRPPSGMPNAAKSTSVFPPELTVSADRPALTLGVVGFLLFGIATQLVWMADLIGINWWILPLYEAFGLVNPFETVALVLIGTSVALSGYAFAAYARAFASRVCHATAVVSFLSAWWLPIANFLQFTGLVWVPASTSYDYIIWTVGPLYPLYSTLQFIGVTMLGVTLLLWPSALVVTRHRLRQQHSAVAAAVLFATAAHVVLLPLPFSVVFWFTHYPYFAYSFYPLFLVVACLVEPACILSAILLYRSRSPK